MVAGSSDLEAAFLGHRQLPCSTGRRSNWALPVALAFLSLGLVLLFLSGHGWGRIEAEWRGGSIDVKGTRDGDDAVEAQHGVVAADDGRCSEIGAAALRAGGHAVDAAVATALCLGVVSPMSSGIGGGAFMVVRSAGTGIAEAFDSRETAPLAASQNMYEKNPASKVVGALSMGVPGELAGLHVAWSKYGRLPWRSLVEPSIQLAGDGFHIAPYLARALKKHEDLIRADPGLSRMFTPDGELLQTGDVCYNLELSRTLAAVASEGPQVLYGGRIGEALVKDVRDAGGLLTMGDMKGYEVVVTEALAAQVLGYEIFGMPPPSSGTVGISLGPANVLNILASYGTPDAAKGSLGLHRLLEALKHMLAVRMNLGDPNFVNVTEYVSDMLSSSVAEKIKGRILDNTTFEPDYYLSKWSQLRDHGTSHFCIVDAERNAVSMTTTVNNVFGAGVLSPSTGIVLNNEMDDFSTPTEITPDKLPPAPSNFIEPGKRPLSSMNPLIVVKDNQLAGIVGGSGGLNIIPAVTQVFLNHFVLGMNPLAAVQHPRVYHKLIPNVVNYENLTAIDGEHIELSPGTRAFLMQRGHHLNSVPVVAVCQLVVHNLQKPVDGAPSRVRINRKAGEEVINPIFHGMLTAVSDPRKDGRPAGM
ncbi:hypothetical protein Taro_007113 [Colocasia esculenta]|uniref:Glutathione hydrolase n=1 Tax=Colocasia esculenta TaxID=4460 RepID=A0A843TT60_COLES|nr:hypothetical protein [Colocasia esculenta]